MGIGIIGDLAQCKGVFVAMIGDDVNVRGGICRFGLDADEARSHMAAVEYPVHRVAGEDVGDFLFVGQYDERRLQKPSANLRRRIRFRHRDRARRARLQRMRFG